MWNFSTPIEKTKITSLAIGCFDGMHLGHLELCKHLDEHCALLIVCAKEENFLTPYEFRQKIINIPLIFVDFNAIKNLSAKEFLLLLCENFLNLEKIVVGYDFKFGKNRQGKAKDITKLCGVKSIIVDEFKKDGISVHTSMIKTLLSNAKVYESEKFLGRFYNIHAKVIKGQGIGSKFLYPTINLFAKNFFMPKNGVYATKIKINHKIYPSVSFLGIRSSDEKFSLETHVLKEDFNENIPEYVELEFIQFIRENKKFDDFSLLKEQIKKDIFCAKQILGNL
ncbi:bifunctional riboflavin kinase/FAD synthetase [Campylobacter lari]|uniref:bifunctional riboflavin kinase/FAD synthetase n=1 Tax=Campylobacter lari TaxID=201 RepID=UPI0012839958|nr:bifunctional riboflavin kinase/FAD synthetase [Campylobacter lari]EAI0281695.1 bifunctional riboflavin kinase/FAD synthetase [Campylobacter lari]EAK0302678.1 bifunctional riboflavin kinase/FAD synthetase [Campylobacter lari]EAL5649513.1 bifunctional riboflavin kinase/FAD synthetase [Campylobacter lari]EAL9301631.1 bifunctional riboflavin kinase/FAD synthetase [Campylobacter lari]EAM0941292.1 bifunctional riboflavin kinase/FAD synthetase [Campylobacter lari]